jgi:flagellum-specific peptidoglycan hydrolase FlgJ
MATKKQIDFVKQVYPAAKRLYEEKQSESVEPVFETVQAALEKGWKYDGKFNMFGITKGSSWTGPVDLELTTEYFSTPNVKFTYPERIVGTPEKLSNGNYKYRVYRFFRKYDSLEECLYDHQALFRKPGYADAWPYRNDPLEFAKRLVDDTGWKYATGPEYYKSMVSIIKTVREIVEQEGLSDTPYMVRYLGMTGL